MRERDLENGRPQGGKLLVDFLIVLLLVGIVVAILLVGSPFGGCGSKIEMNEISAKSSLRNLTGSQEQFRAAAKVDLDGDGAGEFGTFAELTGTDGVRTTADGATRGKTIVPPILSPAYAGVADNGVLNKSGYHFRILLPGPGGRAVHEGRSSSWRPVAAPGAGPGAGAAPPPSAPGFTPFSGPVDTDLAEKQWCAYAWPFAHGNTGNRVFFADQAGNVWQTANEDKRYQGSAAGPAWDAAMPAAGTGWTPTNPKVKEYRGRDGSTWKAER